jgi:hypothetical protein
MTVCWDNFDANEIWAQVSRERSTRSVGKQPVVRERKETEREERRPSVINDGGAGSWRRGVALPPTGEGSGRRNGRYDEHADNPEDLWDDPSTPQIGAAADFSAFGGTLDGEPLKAGVDAFDLAQMSEAAKNFEDDFRGNKNNSDNSRDSSGDDDDHDHTVNPTRPLASAGTTIRSGSGDDVNVFEDFGEPEARAKNDGPTIKSGDEAQTASSRLMQMIGVTNDANTNETETSSKIEQKETENTKEEAKADSAASLFSFSLGVSKNPWGDPSPSASNAQPEVFGLDLAAKLRDSTVDKHAEMQNEVADRMKKEEMERIRLIEVEEEKRRVALAAQQQQQAELLARQQAAAREQQKQSQQGPGQVELILTERISTILENSWGRSDLVSVLSTLHNEDSRVVPLLGTVNALSALIARHPRRFALAKDPSFGTEMAVLLMNNASWQQQQQAEEVQRKQQEEHQKMMAARQEAARVEAETRAQNVQATPIIITDKPWFYADPQGNVQVRYVH